LYYFIGTADSDLAYAQEESPSCYKTVFHLTNGRSNTRESATESRHLLLADIWAKAQLSFASR